MVLNSFGNKRGLGTFLFSQYSSFAVIVSSVLIYFTKRFPLL